MDYRAWCFSQEDNFSPLDRGPRDGRALRARVRMRASPWWRKTVRGGRLALAWTPKLGWRRGRVRAGSDVRCSRDGDTDDEYRRALVDQAEERCEFDTNIRGAGGRPLRGTDSGQQELQGARKCSSLAP